MGAGFRFLLIALVMLCARPAHALDVLLVRPDASDTALFEAFGRLRAELELQGFTVRVLPKAASQINTDDLERAAQEQGAFAAVALERGPDGSTAEIHIVDRVTGKTTTRKLMISKAKDGPLLLAIRAADLLRASLLELEPGERPPEDVVGADKRGPPREVVSFSRELPRFQIGAGGLLLWQPELGVSIGGSLVLMVRAVPRFTLGLEVGGPAFGGDFHVNENTASVREEFALARFVYDFGAARPGPRWQWGPVAEMGVVHMTARGEVAPPLVSESSDLWSMGLLGGVLVEYFFTDTVSLGGELKALGLIPQPVIAIDDEQSKPLSVQGVATLRLGVSF